MGEGVVLGPRHEFSKQCESVGVRGVCNEQWSFYECVRCTGTARMVVSVLEL